MFGLFSKSKANTGPFDFSIFKTDIHSHLLPGIDDGAPDLETSLLLIRGMKELGYEKLITTPHIMWDMYRNTPAIIREKLELVRDAVKQEGIEIEIDAAAEYFLDEHVEELLQKKEPLLTLYDNKVLTEFSMVFPAMNTKTILFEMQMQGYQPVIAHPERYIYLQRNKEFYDELRNTGCLFQLNLLALGGRYGKAVAELTQYLLKNDFYTLIGSDLHHQAHLQEFQHLQVSDAFAKVIDWEKFTNNRI
jgi:tyrosine-protein phosphatase YwqE